MLQKKLRLEIISREDGEISSQSEEKGFQMRRPQVQRLRSMRDLDSVQTSCASRCPASRCCIMAIWTGRS